MIRHNWIKLARKYSPDIELYQCSVCKEIASSRMDYDFPINYTGNALLPTLSNNWYVNCDLAVIKEIMEL